jgi:exonuclease VII large subunit
MSASQTQMQLKFAEMQERAQEAKRRFAIEMQRLEEEITFRRLENEQRRQELDASIRLKELQIENEVQKGAVSAMSSLTPQKTDVEQSREQVELAQNKIKLAQMQAEYAALVSRLQGFDGIQEILDKIGADPADMSPIAPRKPKDRVYTIIRNQTGQMEQVVAQDVPTASQA